MIVSRQVRNAAFAEEKAEVEVLQARVSGHADLGKKLAALSTRLQGSGTSVTESIGPIHDNTRDHQTIANNIDMLNGEITRMIEQGQDIGNEKGIIRAGPGQAGLTEFLGSIKRLHRTQTKMSSSNMRVQQQTIGDINELLDEGSLKLQDYFRTMIAESTAPVEPLQYITKQRPFPRYGEDQTSQLAAIQKVLSSMSSSPQESPTVRIYSDLRASYLVSSLQSMSIACISTSKRKNSAEPYRQGTSAIGSYASSMEGIFTAEFHNIVAIFGRDDGGIAFEITCRRPMAEFARTLRELNMYIHSNLMTDCFLAYEILETATSVAHRLSRETNELKLPFSDALKPIRETAKRSLPALLEDQRNRIGTLPILPADGKAILFTAETMTRLQTMTAYPRSVSSILASIGDGNWTSSATANQSSNSSTPQLRSLDVGADGEALQAHYALDTIETHLKQLEVRAHVLNKNKAIVGVFISNSVAVVERMIRSSDLASLFSSNVSAQQKLDSWRKKGANIYLEAWKDCSSTLLDSVNTSNRASGNRPASGTSMPSADFIKSLSSKDKDAIKERFKHFNSSFEEAVRKHREMLPSMEREVKSGLGREVGHVIEPLYSRFWDRYEALDRGRGKYVKWDKGTLAALLASLE